MQDAPASTSPRRGARLLWLALLLAAGVALGAGLGYRYGRQPAPDVVVLTQDQVAAQRLAVRQRDAEAQRLRAELDAAVGELAVERGARTELEAQLKAAQAEAGRAQDRLAFYEQLLPPGPEGTVDIRGAQLERAGPGLHYKVLLMRSGRGGTALTGMLAFRATGVLDGQLASLDLSPLKADVPADAAAGPVPEPNPLALQFDQYQRSEGLLELPAGFEPQTVTVSVLEGDTVRTSRTVEILSPGAPGL